MTVLLVKLLARSLLVLRVHLARLRKRISANHGLSPADAAAVAAAITESRQEGTEVRGEDLETIMGVAAEEVVKEDAEKVASIPDGDVDMDDAVEKEKEKDSSSRGDSKGEAEKPKTVAEDTERGGKAAYALIVIFNPAMPSTVRTTSSLPS